MAFNFFNTKLIDAEHVYYVYDLVKNIVAPGDRAFISPRIKNIIDETLDERLPEGWRSDKKLLKDISISFRKNNFSTYADKYFPDYYAAYYLPNNIYKIQLMFLEIFRYGKISFSEQKIKVLDIGSAVGTTAWALYDFYEILSNILQLYGINNKKLPLLEIDSIEKYQSNIDFFNTMNEKINSNESNVKINEPFKRDVLKESLNKNDLSKYDVVIASNIINEFPSHEAQKDFVKQISNGIKKSASFILVETAIFKDTKSLKKIQFENAKSGDLQIISPCGKLNSYSERCNDCYSFRRESLKIPDTMKIFSEFLDESDENEKLKWSYTVYSKDKHSELTYSQDKSISLNEISLENNSSEITITVEIVSGKMWLEHDKNYYYLKLCDQTEDKEEFVLKIPNHFELPHYHFGDVFEISNVKIEEIKWTRPYTVKYAIKIDPNSTIVKNRSQLSEPKGLVAFKNIEEKNILFFLERFFGYKKFNDGQFEIIKKVLQNENVLGILATGGGKSLAYQLPALLKPGVSIIVSPLKSLMDDQVHGLKHRFGFDFVDRIHSGMEIREKEAVFERFKNGYLKILYIAPERIQQKTFQQELKRLITKGININYFPIDEAHCISEWGHDFRPSYSKLKERQKDLPHVDNKYPSIIALTATASDKVQDDILDQLNMNEDRDVVHRIVDRKELSLEVIPMVYDSISDEYNIQFRDPVKKESFISHSFTNTERYEVLEYILEEVLPKRFDSFDIKKDAGLIFTVYADPKPAKEIAIDKLKKNKGPELGTPEFESALSKLETSILHSNECREAEGANWLSHYLNEKGYLSQPWYAQPGYRKYNDTKQPSQKDWEKVKVKTQKKFINNDLNLLVTTKGFGMGIDKPNVRYVIHYGFPGSLESYFQQIGRAGRDRGHSHCILIWDSPAAECNEYLNNFKNTKKNAVPECYKMDDDTNKYSFTECPYGRKTKCDYAKQVHFLENSYPTAQELQASLNYLTSEGKNKSSYPWVYIKRKYLSQAVGNDLGFKTFKVSADKKLIDSLNTLKFIENFSETYLKVSIKRTVTFRQIFESTNNQIVREHIQLLNKLYKGFIDTPPPSNGAFNPFPIDEYVQKLRKELKKEVLIDEIVQFFNVLNERNDINIKYNYGADYGYEIKINDKMVNMNVSKAKSFEKVTAWKKSQYAMLENVVKYSNLQPFSDDIDSSGDKQCRRSHIMTVFSTKGAKAGKDVRCDFCDNCGYNNTWEEQATDIIAGQAEHAFRNNLRDYFKNQSKNSLYLENNFDAFLDIVKIMIKDDFLTMGETITDAWMEQIGEDENLASILFLSIVNHSKGDLNRYKAYLSRVFQNIQTNISFSKKIILSLVKIIKVKPKDIYNNHYKTADMKLQMEAIKIFSSKNSQNFSELETEIGLNIIDIQNARYSNIISKYERLKTYG